ncbi:MAG: DUF2516 family protein [Demequinaceae bacterium]|nr:DUF2516 family protein [Demequinaceae bacterium]
MFGFAQDGLLLILGIAAFIVEVYALVDSLKYTNEQYYAAGKRNKAFWTAMTGSAAAVGFLTLPPPIGHNPSGVLSILGLAAVVVAGVYLTDVRAALRSTRRPPRSSRGGW